MGMRNKRATVLVLVITGILSVGTLAYASHTFTDVPEGHTFHNAIEWMQDSDITKGCNPPANDQYCPDDFVTRGQMAAFFARAANSRTFDAGTLDGLDSSEFAKKGEPAGAGDADTLDGFDSTDFVQVGDPVTDSDSLDGKDSSEFLSSTIQVRETEESVLLGPLDITTECDAGETVIGGGFESVGGLGVNVTDNHPTDDGWNVAGTVSVLGTITVYAICAASG